jgi:hypothetical protein
MPPGQWIERRAADAAGAMTQVPFTHRQEH